MGAFEQAENIYSIMMKINFPIKQFDKRQITVSL